MTVKDNITDKVYAILDYDGYICKSFYANTENPMDMDCALEILQSLEQSALEKTAEYFNVNKNQVKLLKIMSGHSWKKDIYPSYKRKRKKNEFLGVYRDTFKTDKTVTLVQPLEADEVLVVLSDLLTAINGRFVLFSDDKDLKYYTQHICKINLTEQIIEQDPLDIYSKQIEQMIIGDSEDNIKGIPKVGAKTAPKLLSQYSYDLQGVARLFRDKEIDIDNCLRDLLLVIPLSTDYTTDAEPSFQFAESILRGMKPDDLQIHTALINQITYISQIVKEVYDETETP